MRSNREQNAEAKLAERKHLKHCVLFKAEETMLREGCVAKADEIARILKANIDWRRGKLGRFKDDEI